jgi:hypothetical protein
MSKATPSFEQPFYQVRISESLPIGSVALTVHAQSPTGGKLIYSITSGDKYDEFAAHFSTGQSSASLKRFRFSPVTSQKHVPPKGSRINIAWHWY